jgi:hypothetical protein
VNATILNPGWTTSLAGAPLPGLVPADERMHPVPDEASYAWTETSYWGFCAPDHDLMAEIYIWFHPHLKVMSAGILIWRGFRGSSLAADYVNHHHFLPLPDRIDHYRIEALGLEIEIIEPLDRARLRMQDPERGVSFDVTAVGAIPPVSRPNGHHLVQPMKVEGSLDLYGDIIPIDGHFMRDRSWGADRHETVRDLPPITWMTGMADDFSFHIVAFDDPALGPDWAGEFTEPAAGANLVWGYLHQDGRTTSIVRAAKRTRREADGHSPRGFDLEIEDAEGRTLVLRGEVTARVPWSTWQNIVVHYSLTRWTIGDRIAWGDCQDIHYNRYVHRFAR